MLHTYSLVYLSSLFNANCLDQTFSALSTLRYLFNYNDLLETQLITGFNSASSRLLLSERFFANNFILVFVLASMALWLVLSWLHSTVLSKR
jgi:hypothetical protein